MHADVMIEPTKDQAAKYPDLAGKTYLVTGASSGIGAVTALALGRAGANVVLAARRLDACEALAAQIQAGGGQALALVSAVNGALIAYARALAVELAPIRVNTVSPGWVDTPIWGSIATDDVKANMFRDMAGRLPVGRIGEPKDIAAAVTLLLTNSYMTGTTLEVDGGRRLL